MTIPRDREGLLVVSYDDDHRDSLRCTCQEAIQYLVQARRKEVRSPRSRIVSFEWNPREPAGVLR